MEADALLRSVIEDRIQQCENQYRITNTAFLDLHQRTLTEEICRSIPGLRWGLYGGFPGAERVIAVFFPDYVDLEETDGSQTAGAEDFTEPKTKAAEQEQRICGYFRQNPEDDPLELIKISVPKGSRTLSHRDYLGSLLGLGLKRETTGDILVREQGADIMILKDIGEFVEYNYTKAGRTSLSLTRCRPEECQPPALRIQKRSDTVSSLRLDNLTASAFSVSRSKAAEAIRSGQVFVNHMEALKADAVLQEGDRISWRGKGKVCLEEVGGKSRKDRIFVVFIKYV